MNRRLSRGLLVPLFLLMIFALISCDGCDDPVRPLPNTVRNYGPPLFDVVFVDGTNYIATIDPVNGTKEYYVEHVGNNQDLSTPGLGVLYKMTSPASATNHLLVYDYSTSTLNIMNDEGYIVYEYTDIIPEFYDASESRVVRVQEVENGYQLQTSRWESTLPTNTMGTVSAPYYYASRPSLNSTANRAVIAIYNSDDASVNRLAVMGENDYESATKLVTALAPQYSPETSDYEAEYIAYLEAPNGPEAANTLVVIDNSLDIEIARFDFGQYGVGATSFSWSPDGNSIALYADIYGPNPKLIIIDFIATQIASHGLDGYTITLGNGDDLYWAFPEWNEESTELVIPAKIDIDGETEYHVIVYNIEEDSTRSISSKGAMSTHPHWRKYEY